MVSPFSRLDVEELRRLAAALRAGRVAPPYPDPSLRRHVPDGLGPAIGPALRARSAAGSGPNRIAEMLELLADDRDARRAVETSVDLVWTGPKADGPAARDTAVVVRELFRNARRSVLVAGYAVHRGDLVFRERAERMDERPELRARMFLDVRRPFNDDAPDSEIVRRFARRFAEKDWPGLRRPEVHYDPRSLRRDGPRACLHAKCVVIDGETALVSSANFTEAAQLRNIEVGAIVRSADFAARLEGRFDALIASGALAPVPLP